MEEYSKKLKNLLMDNFVPKFSFNFQGTVILGRLCEFILSVFNILLWWCCTLLHRGIVTAWKTQSRRKIKWHRGKQIL